MNEWANFGSPGICKREDLVVYMKMCCKLYALHFTFTQEQKPNSDCCLNTSVLQS